MKSQTQLISYLALALAFLLALTDARADDYTVSVPDYEVNPGTQLVVPVTLDNAAGLAQIRIQLNYDSQVLQLDGITAGPLGEQFDVSHEMLAGSITIDFIRTSVLAAGAGQLARLEFTANAGATIDLYSDLAIAEFEIGDASGVRDLTQANHIIITNGSVNVSLDRDIDNVGNGIPDWWELQHDLDLFAPITGEDLDDDSLDRLLEFAFGGDPNVADFKAVAPSLSTETLAGDSYQVLTVRRRVDSTLLDYLLEDSSDLLSWSPGDIAARMISAPVDLGGGLESISLRGRFALDGAVSERDFMRIGVQPLTQ